MKSNGLLMDIMGEKLFKEIGMFTDEYFTFLVKTYIDTVFRVALSYTKHWQEAEDITQSVFFALLREKKPFETEAHIKHWLIRVAMNECKKKLRSPWRAVVPLEDCQIAFPTQEHSELYDAVMDLPVKYRMPLYLHYYEGYSTEEIAKLLRMPKGTVCTNLKRGREQLKHAMQEDESHG